MDYKLSQCLIFETASFACTSDNKVNMEKLKACNKSNNQIALKNLFFCFVNKTYKKTILHKQIRQKFIQ
jgi:uncharacterized protein (DUF362 family)